MYDASDSTCSSEQQGDLAPVTWLVVRLDRGGTAQPHTAAGRASTDHAAMVLKLGSPDLDDLARALRERLAATAPAITTTPASPARSTLLIAGSSRESCAELAKITAAWGYPTTCTSPSELQAHLQAGVFDLLLVEPASALRPLLSSKDGEATQHATLAEVTRRHILRVLAAANGNKTKAARSLRIDPKTLRNKLGRYRAQESAASRRIGDA